MDLDLWFEEFDEADDVSIVHNITSDNFFNFSLKELEKIEDKALRLEGLTAYNDVLRSMPKDLRVTDNISLYDMVGLIEKFEYENTSDFFWPSQHVVVYNNFKQYHTRKRIICHLCSEIIRPGQSYLIYRPLLHNIDAKMAYILSNDIIVIESCQHYMPSNIRELEEMEINIGNSYDNPDSDNKFPNNHPLNNNQIEYAEFHNNIGGGFHFVKLKQKK